MAPAVRLHPLKAGEAKWPEAWRHRADGPLAGVKALGAQLAPGKLMTIPLPAFLVEHPTEGPILIDTGLNAAVTDDKTSDMGRVTAVLAARSFAMKREWAVPEQLRARGVDPADVKLVLMTHLHLDHASGMSQFPGATFVVSRAEWEAANGSNPLLHGYVQSHYRNATTRLLDFDDVGSTSDLLGDGSVRLIYTPGHTLGHMSVLLRTEGREVLVAGDAVYTRHALETGHRPYLMEDPRAFGRSLELIQSHAREHPDTLVIPGHDMEDWQKLDAVYG
jgi:glyoxylase-like metal-dependent hydrolase (beta-lactamase superfamily II)